jgi:hypothetical protein
MANDFKQKEPSKTEKMLYELAMHQNRLENQTFSNSMTILAVALAMDADAEKIAKYLTTDEEKIKELGKKINDLIDKSKEKEKAVEDLAPKV